MDMVTQIEMIGVRGVRRLALTLAHDEPLTVVTGPTGSGKTTIVECLGLLGAAGRSSEEFYLLANELLARRDLQRRENDKILLQAVIFDGKLKLPTLRYAVVFGLDEGKAVVVGESLGTVEPDKDDPNRFDLIRMPDVGGFRSPGADIMAGQPAWRRQRKAKNNTQFTVRRDQLVLHTDAHPGANPVLRRAAEALSKLTMATFRPGGDPEGEQALTEDSFVTHDNDAPRWRGLKEGDPERWQRALGLARIVLGPSLGNIHTFTPPGGGERVLEAHFADVPAPVRAERLTQIQREWLMALGWVFTYQRPGALLAIAQPEWSFPEEAIGALAWELRRAKTRTLFATQSDAVLRLLRDPTESLYVGRQIEPDRIVFAQPQAKPLRAALRRHGDLAWVRANGALDETLGERLDDEGWPPPPDQKG
ncbi:MAG: AAA family ATPase [Deltaproteobacteria bacterium]|nr:AAA family ATPase [Deltaproteobacteria bacterium]